MGEVLCVCVVHLAPGISQSYHFDGYLIMPSHLPLRGNICASCKCAVYVFWEYSLHILDTLGHRYQEKMPAGKMKTPPKVKTPSFCKWHSVFCPWCVLL